MFNTLREELNKIALMEDDELEMINNHVMDGDEGAADDELYDDLEEGEEEEDLDDVESDSLNEAIDMIVNEMLVNESYSDGYFDEDDEYDYDNDDYDYYNEEDDTFDDNYDDDDFDDDYNEVDMDFDVIGDGKTVKGNPDDDEYDEVDIGGVTNAIHSDIELNEDIEEDDEEELDDLLEAMLLEGDDCPNGNCEHTVRGTARDIYGDSADMPDDDVPPAPQYSKLYARNKVGSPIANYGAGNYGKYGKTFLDREIMSSMTVDDDEYEEDIPPQPDMNIDIK